MPIYNSLWVCVLYVILMIERCWGEVYPYLHRGILMMMWREKKEALVVDKWREKEMIVHLMMMFVQSALVILMFLARLIVAIGFVVFFLILYSLFSSLILGFFLEYQLALLCQFWLLFYNTAICWIVGIFYIILYAILVWLSSMANYKYNQI